MNWHQQKTDEAMQNLGSSAQGLSADEVRIRLLEHGPNELTETAKKTVFMMFLDQFKDFMILVLIAAAVFTVGVLRGEPPLLMILKRPAGVE